MSNNVPRPSAKPVWPIVVACLVLVVGIAVAAVFIGINLSDSDDQAAGSKHRPAYAAAGDDSGSDGAETTPADREQKSKSDDSKKSDPESDDTATKKPDDDADEKSDKPAPEDESDKPTDPPESTSNSADPRLDCGSAKTLLITRTETFGASICRTASGADVYRGLSENIDGSLVLHASFDKANNQWVATNQKYEYSVDAATGQLTIENQKTGEVYGTEPAIQFRTK